jgi:hypothetical protein
LSVELLNVHFIRYHLTGKGLNMKLHSVLSMATIIGASVLSGCGTCPDHVSQALPQAPDVPASLRVAPGQTLNLATRATGVQIYECGVDKGDSTKFTWNFKAPEAELFDLRDSRTDQKIAKHYGGPTWEGNDGSKVVGQVKSSENSSDANAIAWLLLSAKSNSGDGIFGKTTSIQRINTSGGKAPTSGCDLAHVGSVARTPYTAQYYFYN